MNNAAYCPACGTTEFKNENGKPSCTKCGRIVTEEEIAADIKKRFEELNTKEKMYALNEDSVAEYIAATSKIEALDYCEDLWGKDVVEQYFNEFKEENPSGTYEDFIEDFVREMPEDEEFSLWNDDIGKVIVKTIGEFLKDITEFPSHFACSEY
ncbi:hypothetical protein [Ruminiclostridium cellulolyticum]|uniref:Uncharacterized protein n=1 Tax=Ruminiclostridium cellulolyticum (strain ATCC 35319 / DSM 5812 / JCM 6584 / H10) TaxID=394503 RepID=B8I0B4_RUMCH|nr:hypothetical protein [Ruminiclostridium cellulolyticum]ACL77440.1 hypothetical protein Ccel_3149 [Ruminiclostridium cellulolyticum H10]